LDHKSCERLTMIQGLTFSALVRDLVRCDSPAHDSDNVMQARSSTKPRSQAWRLFRIASIGLSLPEFWLEPYTPAGYTEASEKTG
jgi:hypothetical protein